jgi:hypothetical protein
MKNPKRIAFALALLLPAPAVAQVGQVNGTILSHDRQAVAGASVALIPQNSSIIYGTSTGKDGRYAFKGLAADTYSVVVLPLGGGVARKDDIKVRALFRSIVDFNLAADGNEATLPPPAGPADGEGAGPFAFSCELTDPSRDAIPDATVVLLPVEGDGEMRHDRTAVDGRCRNGSVPGGIYRIAAKAPGFISWSIGPVALRGLTELELALSMEAFPMGFRAGVEDLLIPPEPIPPPEP